MVVVAEDWWRFAEEWVDHRTKRGVVVGKMAAGGRMSGPGAGCPGRAGCPGHEPDVRGARGREELLAHGDFGDKIHRILRRKIGEKWRKS